MTEKKHFFN